MRCRRAPGEDVHATCRRTTADSLRWHLRVLGAEAEQADFDTDDYLGREVDHQLVDRESNNGVALNHGDMDPDTLAHWPGPSG